MHSQYVYISKFNYLRILWSFSNYGLLKLSIIFFHRQIFKNAVSTFCLYFFFITNWNIIFPIIIFLKLLWPVMSMVSDDKVEQDFWVFSFFSLSIYSTLCSILKGHFPWLPSISLCLLLPLSHSLFFFASIK